MTYTPTRHANDQTPTVLSLRIHTSSESSLRRFVDQLVKRRVHVISELNFGNRSHSLKSCSDSKPHNALFGQGCVEHSVIAKLRSQVHTVTHLSQIRKSCVGTRCGRYLQRNTPPKATSSPKSKTRGSVRSACERAELMAWNRFNRVAVPFLASEDNSVLANADLEL